MKPISKPKRSRIITERSFEKVIVDTTVQPKAIQHPTDARLYRKVHAAMLRIAEAEDLDLRQSYRKLMVWDFRKHGGHMKAKQFKRAKRVLRSLKTMAGRVFRDVERKLDDAGFQRHKGTLILSELILGQKRKTKNKVYSLHASEVECIGKGKAHRPYEFGVKVSLAVTHKEGFCVGIQTCPGNPFDGHTLEGQLDQVERLTGRVPGTTFVDKGYQGHGVDPKRSRVLISGTRKLGYALRRQLRRRAAICGAGHNLRKILARLRALLYLLTGEARAALSDFLDRIRPLSDPRPTPMAA